MKFIFMCFLIKYLFKEFIRVFIYRINIVALDIALYIALYIAPLYSSPNFTNCFIFLFLKISLCSKLDNFFCQLFMIQFY